jgi:hypothetical protein
MFKTHQEFKDHIDAKTRQVFSELERTYPTRAAAHNTVISKLSELYSNEGLIRPAIDIAETIVDKSKKLGEDDGIYAYMYSHVIVEAKKQNINLDFTIGYQVEMKRGVTFAEMLDEARTLSASNPCNEVELKSCWPHPSLLRKKNKLVISTQKPHCVDEQISVIFDDGTFTKNQFSGRCELTATVNVDVYQKISRLCFWHSGVFSDSVMKIDIFNDNMEMISHLINPSITTVNALVENENEKQVTVSLVMRFDSLIEETYQAAAQTQLNIAADRDLTAAAMPRLTIAAMLPLTMMSNAAISTAFGLPSFDSSLINGTITGCSNAVFAPPKGTVTYDAATKQLMVDGKPITLQG